MNRVRRHVGDLLGYLERNRGALVPYAARRRRGEPISTAFVESAVNEVVAKRMTKRQQMRWNRATVQPFLDVRTAVLNDTLEGAFNAIRASGPRTMTRCRQKPPDHPHDFACSRRPTTDTPPAARTVLHGKDVDRPAAEARGPEQRAPAQHRGAGGAPQAGGGRG